MTTDAISCGRMRTVAQPGFPFTSAPTFSSPGAKKVTSPWLSAPPTSNGAANHTDGFASMTAPDASKAVAVNRIVWPTSASATPGVTCTRSGRGPGAGALSWAAAVEAQRSSRASTRRMDELLTR
jgi:hypothetical protein